MARKGKKTGGRDFRAGNQFGKGRPLLPPELKAVRKLTQAEFIALCNKYLKLTPTQLGEAAKNPEITVLEGIVISILTRAGVNGDTVRLQFFLDRMIGKVVEKSESSHSIDISVKQMSNAELLKAMPAAMAYLKEHADDGSEEG